MLFPLVENSDLRFVIQKIHQQHLPDLEFLKIALALVQAVQQLSGCFSQKSGSSLDAEVADPAMATLHAELIKLNLEAFQKNPTDDMDKARANFLGDRFFNQKETAKENND